jgi:hypothetical protein
MCKIYGLTSTQQLAPAALSSLIERAHKHLTQTQKDGWGYALGSYVERWDTPADWPGHGKWHAIQQSLGGMAVAVDCLVSEGKPPAPGPSLICHARTATCARGAENAHPHSWDGWRIVHNGVVESLGKARRSCDSMHIVDSLAKHKGAAGLHKDLAGYLAILGTSPRGEFVALRDDRAPLFVAWCADLSAWAFASSPELLAAITALPVTRPYSLTPFACHTLTPDGWQVETVEAWSGAAESRAAVAFGGSAYYRPSDVRKLSSYEARKLEAEREMAKAPKAKKKKPADEPRNWGALSKPQQDELIARAWPDDPVEMDADADTLAAFEAWQRRQK